MNASSAAVWRVISTKSSGPPIWGHWQHLGFHLFAAWGPPAFGALRAGLPPCRTRWPWRQPLTSLSERCQDSAAILTKNGHRGSGQPLGEEEPFTVKWLIRTVWLVCADSLILATSTSWENFAYLGTESDWQSWSAKNGPPGDSIQMLRESGDGTF